MSEQPSNIDSNYPIYTYITTAGQYRCFHPDARHHCSTQTIMGIKMGDALVGYVAYLVDGKTAYIDVLHPEGIGPLSEMGGFISSEHVVAQAVFLKESARGKGIMSGALRELFAKLQDEGIERIKLVDVKDPVFIAHVKDVVKELGFGSFSQSFTNAEEVGCVITIDVNPGIETQGK